MNEVLDMFLLDILKNLVDLLSTTNDIIQQRIIVKEILKTINSLEEPKRNKLGETKNSLTKFLKDTEIFEISLN